MKLPRCATDEGLAGPLRAVVMCRWRVSRTCSLLCALHLIVPADVPIPYEHRWFSSTPSKSPYSRRAALKTRISRHQSRYVFRMFSQPLRVIEGSGILLWLAPLFGSYPSRQGVRGEKPFSPACSVIWVSLDGSDHRGEPGPYLVLTWHMCCTDKLRIGGV